MSRKHNALSKAETREYIAGLRAKKVKNPDIAEYCGVSAVTVSIWNSEKTTATGTEKLKQMFEEWNK